MWMPTGVFLWWCLSSIAGIRTVVGVRKVLYGFFGARDEAGIRSRAVEVYEASYARIREVVPSERRLEYRIGDK
jgi:hypothetical protein